MTSPASDRIVGIDYLSAVTHPPGVGRYLRELVRALVRLEQRPELRLLEVGGGSRVMEGPPLGLAGAARVRRLRSRLPRRTLDLLSRMGLGAARLLGGVGGFRPYPRPYVRGGYRKTNVNINIDNSINIGGGNRPQTRPSVYATSEWPEPLTAVRCAGQPWLAGQPRCYASSQDWLSPISSRRPSGSI